MKIICTVNEFAKMVRKCDTVNCYSCALSGICSEHDGNGIERFVSAEDVIPEPNMDKVLLDGKEMLRNVQI